MFTENKTGGYTLASYVKSYDVKQKDLCDEVKYKSPINKIALAKQEKLWFAVAYDKYVEIFKIDQETGKMTMMQKIQADFGKNAKVNTVEFIYGNQHIVTGGNDCCVRVWKLNVDKQKDEVTDAYKLQEYTSHQTPVTKVDVTFDHDLIASIGSEEEKTVYIHDFKTGSLVNELTFSEKHGSDLMGFQGCIFSHHRKYLYTLASEPGKKSYVTRWETQSGEFRNLNTIKVADNFCANFSLSFEGFYLAIGSENGYIKSLNTRYMQLDRNDKFHNGTMD